MSTKTPWWIRVPVLFFLIFGLMEFFIDSGDKPAIIEYPITQFFLLLVLMILIAIELILASIENIMFQTLSEEGKERYMEAKSKKFEWTWAKNLMKKLTKSRSIEREGEIVLDHNYDGIRELDNVLPPWWVYLFYGTIVFAVVYLVRFHIIGDYDQKLEYEQEVAAELRQPHAHGEEHFRPVQPQPPLHKHGDQEQLLRQRSLLSLSQRLHQSRYQLPNQNRQLQHPSLRQNQILHPPLILSSH